MYVLRDFELTCLLAFITVFCETTIKWDIKGDYLIYGQNATLTCNGNSCPSKAIRKWLGGPNYNLLCFDNYSTEPRKYEMMSNNTRPEFELMIKEFDFDDASCEYTCSCGFLQYTNRLNLDDSNFIYLPVVNKDSSKQNAETFQVDLSMTVFPLPKCTLFYEENTIPMNLTVKKGSTRSDLEYTARIQHTIDLKSFKCKGNVSIECQVRSLKHRLVHRSIDFCEGKDEKRAKYMIIIIISASGLLIVSALVATAAYIFVRIRRSNIENPNFNEMTEVEFVLEASLPNEPSLELVTPMLNDHTENSNDINEHSPIAQYTQTRENEKG